MGYNKTPLELAIEKDAEASAAKKALIIYSALPATGVALATVSINGNCHFHIQHMTKDQAINVARTLLHIYGVMEA